MTERARPFSIKLKIEMLKKSDIDAIIKNIAYLDPKSTIDKEGKIMKLDFPASSAFGITLEDFVFLLIEATGRRIFASVEDGIIHFKFSRDFLTPKSLQEVKGKVEEIKAETSGLNKPKDK